MSTYWGFRCKKCKNDDDQPVLETWFNRRPEVARLCYQAWPHVKVIRGLDTDGLIQMPIFGDHGETEVWDFLAKHYEHGVEICNEYGGVQEEVAPEVSPPGVMMLDLLVGPGESHAIKFEQPRDISILQQPGLTLELKGIIPLLKKCDAARLKRLQKALQLVIDIFADDDDQASRDQLDQIL